MAQPHPKGSVGDGLQKGREIFFILLMDLGGRKGRFHGGHLIGLVEPIIDGSERLGNKKAKKCLLFFFINCMTHIAFRQFVRSIRY